MCLYRSEFKVRREIYKFEQINLSSVAQQQSIIWTQRSQFATIHEIHLFYSVQIFLNIFIENTLKKYTYIVY